MKGFNDASFLNAFNRIMATAKSGPTAIQWSVAEVTWRRDRHGFTGQDYVFQMEAHRLIARGPKPWELLVVMETWWLGQKAAITRQSHWGKVLHGSRDAVLKWFRAQEKLLP